MVPVAKRPGWITLGSALVFHVLLLSLQTNQHGGPGFMRKWLLNALVPAEKLVDSGVQGVWGVWNGYIALIGVREDNHKLQAENDQLRMRIQSQDEAIREAQRLRAFLGLSESGVGKLVAARVIGRDPSRSLLTVTLDKGLGDGIKLDASVITPAGVVGRVISAGSGSSVVQLITDAQSEVAAMLRESRVQVLFKGTGGRDLELNYIEELNYVEADGGMVVGDELVTSGLDQIHPKGLPLARITSIGEKGEFFSLVLARPLADLARLEEVFVVIEAAKPATEPPSSPKGSPAPLPSD